METGVEKLREPPRTLSVRAAADALGIGRTKFYQLLQQKTIRSFLLGRRRLVIADDIDSLIEAALAEQMR